jgi:hypothetical protein
MDYGCWSNGVDVWAEFSKVVVAADLMPVASGVDRVDAGFDSAEVAGEVLAAAFIPLEPVTKPQSGIACAVRPHALNEENRLVFPGPALVRL